MSAVTKKSIQIILFVATQLKLKLLEGNSITRLPVVNSFYIYYYFVRL